MSGAWKIVIVNNGGTSRTFTYARSAWLLTDALTEALHTTNLGGVTSVTTTII